MFVMQSTKSHAWQSSPVNLVWRCALVLRFLGQANYLHRSKTLTTKKGFLHLCRFPRDFCQMYITMLSIERKICHVSWTLGLAHHEATLVKLISPSPPPSTVPAKKRPTWCHGKFRTEAFVTRTHSFTESELLHYNGSVKSWTRQRKIYRDFQRNGRVPAETYFRRTCRKRDRNRTNSTSSCLRLGRSKNRLREYFKSKM